MISFNLIDLIRGQWDQSAFPDSHHQLLKVRATRAIWTTIISSSYTNKRWKRGSWIQRIRWPTRRVWQRWVAGIKRGTWRERPAGETSYESCKTFNQWINFSKGIPGSGSGGNGIVREGQKGERGEIGFAGQPGLRGDRVSLRNVREAF